MTIPGATEEETRERAEDRHENRVMVWFTGVLALGTVALGAANLLLWKATRQLVLDAAHNPERQLRAYIGVESSSINLTPGNQPVAGITFENYSNRPAYGFTINAGLGSKSYRQHPLNKMANLGAFYLPQQQPYS